MRYYDYIKLGFKRIDLNDPVEFQQTGYYGFALEYKLTEKVSISVSSTDLENPKLYIQKDNTECNNYILVLDENQIKELIKT